LARGKRESGLYRLLVGPVALVHSSGRLEEPSSFEEAHAWCNAMETGSKPIMDVVIASLVDGYSDTSEAYKIDNLTQWGTLVSRDVIFDEDMGSFSSQHSPSMIEERMEVVVPEVDSKTRDKLDSQRYEERLGLDMPSPSTLAHKRPRWLT
jgi:hypothetical protein